MESESEESDSDDSDGEGGKRSSRGVAVLKTGGGDVVEEAEDGWEMVSG